MVFHRHKTKWILFADNLSIFRFDDVKWLSRFSVILHNKDNKVHSLQIFKKVITCKVFFRSQFLTATCTHYLILLSLNVECILLSGRWCCLLRSYQNMSRPQLGKSCTGSLLEWDQNSFDLLLLHISLYYFEWSLLSLSFKSVSCSKF